MNLQYIVSKNNGLIKQVKKLKDKKYRDQSSQFIVEGVRFTEEAVKSSFKVKYIFISEEVVNNPKIEDIVEELHNETKVYCVNSEILKQLCNTENPQGIMAVVENKKSFIKEDNGFLIFVDKVQDPGNLGTIIRTAHAAGALGVILRKGTVDVYNEKTLRSTMGSIFHVPIIQDEELECLLSLKKKNFKIISSYLQTNKNFYHMDLKQNIIIVVGNEGNGISKEIIEISDMLVKIPMPGNAESLNVAVSAGVMMYEVVRQRLY